MKRPKMTLRGAMLGGAVLTLAAVSVMLAPTSAQAGGGPALDCGPTRVWDCVLPDGSAVEFEGTVCDKNGFEKDTGGACEPRVER